MKKYVCLLSVSLLLAIASAANNIQILNVSIINNGPSNIQVQFDLSWDNSWRINVGPNNYDGAWVFFKYKTASGNWTHIGLTGINNVIGAGFDIYQNGGTPKAGAMIYRESNGMGSVSILNIRLGVSNTLPYDIDVKGFAVEMVYIPGPTTRPVFGDGNGTSESTNAFHYADNTATTVSVIPMEVDPNSFDDAELDTDGIYVYSNDTIQKSNPLGTLDPFPTMKALWCMKYEISQAAYRDFLNTLTYDQQDNHTANTPNSATGTGALTVSGTNRNWLEIKTPGVASTTAAVYGCDASGNNIYDEAGDGEWVACGFLIWLDVAAYLDWAGLAPMTEIQYERMCRGTSSSGQQPAVYGEFAWGTNTIFSSIYTLSGSTASEIATNASPSLGNAAYSTTSAGIGPFRNGIFATGSSNRITSGASFYGIMEMTGNVEEFMITIGTVAGRSTFFVPNGNGTISASGYAQLTVGAEGFWPGMEGNISSSAVNDCSGTCEVTGYAGIVTKGGSYAHAVSSVTVSYRNYVTPNASRLGYRGGRGVLYNR